MANCTAAKGSISLSSFSLFLSLLSASTLKSTRNGLIGEVGGNEPFCIIRVRILLQLHWHFCFHLRFGSSDAKPREYNSPPVSRESRSLPITERSCKLPRQPPLVCCLLACGASVVAGLHIFGASTRIEEPCDSSHMRAAHLLGAPFEKDSGI